MPQTIEIVATALFAVAVLHTFSVSFFARLAHRNGPHAGIWHMLSEVEAVFGVWAFVLRAAARLLPVRRELSTFFVVMALVPLGGSFITEPAAMTLAALLLRDGYFRVSGRAGFKSLTLGVLFVNVSIGGVLTAYAAPPVLMVASTFGWDTAFMAQHFGWRAAVAVVVNALVLTLVCRAALLEGSVGTGKGVDADDGDKSRAPVPPGSC